MAEDTSRPPDPKIVQRVVEAALLEDGARSDVTTKAVVPDGEVGRAAIIAKEGGVLAGLPVAEAVFAALDATVRFAPLLPDGSVICPGDRRRRGYGNWSATRSALVAVRTIGSISRTVC